MFSARACAVARSVRTIGHTRSGEALGLARSIVHLDSSCMARCIRSGPRGVEANAVVGMGAELRHETQHIWRVLSGPASTYRVCQRRTHDLHRLHSCEE